MAKRVTVWKGPARKAPGEATMRGRAGEIRDGRNVMSTAYAATPAGEAERTSTYAWVVLAMLTGIYTFNFLDRQLLAILTENIKADTGLTDADLGKLGGIYFAAFY